jgi:hypothetical protein
MILSPVRLLSILLVLTSGACAFGQQGNQVQWSITFRDLPSDLKANEELIKEHLIVAAEMWTDAIVAKPCTIEIEFQIKPWSARGFGHSMAGVPLGGEKINGKSLVEEGMSHELRTGRDPNGTTPDVEMAFDPEYVKTLWWDPKPRTRKRPVPNEKLDALSVIAHELGHAIAFNGRIDPKTGQANGNESHRMTVGSSLRKGTFSSPGLPRPGSIGSKYPFPKLRTTIITSASPVPGSIASSTMT